MSVKLGVKDLFPYLGDYRPVNIYKGENKIAGWKGAEQSGEELYFENTYNDFVDVEIDGKSVQEGEPSPDYPVEIHSLNNFDVVSSVGRENYLRNSKERIRAPRNSGTAADRYNFERLDYPTVDGQTYAISADVEITHGTFSLITVLVNSGNTGQNSLHVPIENGKITITYTAYDTMDDNTVLLYAGRGGETRGNGVIFRNIKIEKGNTATPYSPAPEDITENDNHPLIDKINLLLSEPLRSVGDVKDRLFRDSDGLWKVERNVGETYFDGSEGWFINTGGSNINTISARLLHPDFVTLSAGDYFDKHIASRFVNTQVYSTENEGTMYNQGKNIFIRINKDRLTTPDLSGIKNWLGKNPLQVIYVKDTSIETLDQEFQDKLNNLRSFRDSNYVYTMGSIEPHLIGKVKVKDM